MKLSYKTVILTGALVLAGCADSSDKPTTTTAPGHDHAAMQAGQRAEVPTTQTPATTSQYTCPMHPHYISDDPDGNCPICGMDLVPVVQSGVNTGGVVVSSEMVQTMGVRTVAVGRSDFAERLRSYGTVEANTRLESMAASRLEGWIDGLTVRAEGDVVKRGQRIYSIYSPDLIAAQKDYLASLQIGNDRRIASVRQRLKSKGMQESLIARLSETRLLIERVPVYAESAGVVTELMVRDGDYLKPGDPILRLQAYDDVWVIAQVPESDLPRVAIGTQAALSFESAPDAAKTGAVDYIYPTIDTRTRTAEVRISVPNGTGALRPGAYANIIFETGEPDASSQRLSIPTQAILRDSRGASVIVALGDGRFESRDVVTGATARGRTEVVKGLTAGQSIVASGQFLLDSEANLREGFSKLAPHASGFDADTPLSELPIDANTLSQIDHMVDTALYFHEALIDGYAIDPYFLDPTLTLIDQLESQFSNSTLTPVLRDAKSAILRAKTAPSVDSLASHLAGLMNAIDRWLIYGAPSHYEDKQLRLYSDPDSGRRWLQDSGLPANPYSDATARLVPWPDPMAGVTP